MNRKLLMCVAISLAAAVAGQAQADPSGVKVGVLTCDVSSGWGLVFGSSKSVNCSFAPAPDRVEHYVGTINKYGVDVGYQKAGVMVWAVFAPGADVRPGALAGNYGGVTGGASIGVGANANVLVGGSDKSIALQPVSLEGVVGLNVAAGVASLNLRSAP